MEIYISRFILKYGDIHLGPYCLDLDGIMYGQKNHFDHILRWAYSVCVFQRQRAAVGWRGEGWHALTVCWSTQITGLSAGHILSVLWWISCFLSHCLLVRLTRETATSRNWNRFDFCTQVFVVCTDETAQRTFPTTLETAEAWEQPVDNGSI